MSRNEGVGAGEQGAEVGVGADEHPALRARFLDDEVSVALLRDYLRDNLVKR